MATNLFGLFLAALLLLSPNDGQAAKGDHQQAQMDLAATAAPANVAPPTAESGPKRHKHLPAPPGAIPLGWGLGIVFCPVVDLFTKRRYRDVRIVTAWRSGLGFIAESWRNLPGPMLLNELGLMCAGAVVFQPGFISAILVLVGAVAGSLGGWLTITAGYRLALKHPDLPPAPAWRLKFGRPERRWLVAMVVAGFVLFGAFLVSRLSVDILSAVYRLIASAYLSHGRPLPGTGPDLVYPHYVLVGAASVMVSVALSPIWPMAMLSDKWKLKEVFKLTSGRWFPIALSMAPLYVLTFVSQLLTHWAVTLAHAEKGVGQGWGIAVALLTTPTLYLAYIPFAVGVSAERYRQLTEAN